MLKWLLVVIGIVVLDQATKVLALQHLVLHDPVAIMPGLNLDLAFNKGAAFSMLAAHSGWQQLLFIGVGIVVSIAILAWLKFSPNIHRGERCALIFVLGGAIGNLIDRVRFGHVVDFIDVYYGDWHWYTFNVADSFITVGAFLLVWTTLVIRE